MGRARLQGTAIAGAALLTLAAGAAVAMGSGHAGSGQGNGPPQQPSTPGVGPGGTSGQGDGPQVRSGGRQVIGAWLDADQEVPPPTGDLDEAHGKFEAKLNRGGRGGMWVGRAKLDYEALSGPATAAHIHMGVLGVSGPVQVGLCGVSGTPACSDGVQTQLSLTNTQLNAIKRGAYYVNVHTATNGPGEIRGQLGTVYKVVANLTVGQERPRPRMVRGATGRLRGYLVKYGNQGHLDTRLTYRRLTGPASAAHLHRGARRQIGGAVVTLCNGTPECKSGVTGMHEVGGSFLAQLLRGRTYVNVHTQKNGRGEIRGQVHTPRAR